jgi:hypothetical protein
LIKISQAEEDFFRNHGWVSIPLGIDSNKIKKTYQALKLMRNNAIKSKYPLGRVYQDKLLKFNLAAIEAPFNNLIVEHEIKELFQEINLGNAIRQITGWGEVYCSLARLFCMGNYKYRGHWHRDLDVGASIESPNRIQVGIFMENQKGFRLFKKQYDILGDKSIVPNENFSKLVEDFHLPIQPNPDCYYEVGGTAGSVLFFNPKLLHQGSTKSSRLDFHMRFDDTPIKGISYSKNFFQDFHIIDYLVSDYSINKIVINNYLPLAERQKMKSRLINSINYFTGLGNFNYAVKWKSRSNLVKDFGRFDLTANTFFQRFPKN